MKKIPFSLLFPSPLIIVFRVLSPIRLRFLFIVMRFETTYVPSAKKMFDLEFVSFMK